MALARGPALRHHSDPETAMTSDRAVDPRAISIVVARPVRTFGSWNASEYQCAVEPPQRTISELLLNEFTATARIGIHRYPMTTSAMAPATGWRRRFIAPRAPAGRAGGRTA